MNLRLKFQLNSTHEDEQIDKTDIITEDKRNIEGLLGICYQSSNYQENSIVFALLEDNRGVAPHKQIVEPDESVDYWNPITQYERWQYYRSCARNDK